MVTKTKTNNLIETLFEVGAHFGFSKSRRHPSVKSFIFGSKGKTDILDLEKTEEMLDEAKEFIKEVASQGKQVLFVGGKPEAKEAIIAGATVAEAPYVAGRWIGGTLTNFEQIGKRVKELEDLSAQKSKGELSKYTKRERGLIDKKIEKLEEMFGGLVTMKNLPGAVFVVDSKKENIAVREAKVKDIPVISLSGSDCDISKIDYPILANDSARKSIKFFVDEIAKAYTEGVKSHGKDASTNDKKEK